MSVRFILLPVFVHVTLVFALLFFGKRTDAVSGWRDELSLGALYYVLTIFAWHTQFADLLFLVLAWVFVALRIINCVPYSSEKSHPALFVVSAIVLAVTWIIYAVRLLLILG